MTDLADSIEAAILAEVSYQPAAAADPNETE
jgi:hypothetical protein